LKSSHAPVRDRALDVLLADGTQQSIRTLVDAATKSKELLVEKFAQVKGEELKGALLRVLMLRSEPATLSSLLAACDDVVVVIKSENDPLLAALTARQPGDVQCRLLKLLARADLRAVGDSTRFNEILHQVSVEYQNDPAVRAALLDLALALFKQLPYQAPIAREEETRGGRGRETPGIEPLLARLATDPNAKQETSRAAAIALVSAGRLAALQEEILKTPDHERTQDLVRTLGEEESLKARGALPAFLASCLAHPDARTAQLALAALADLYRDVDPQRRWRLNVAVKQALPLENLVRLTLDKDDRVARRAMALLGEVAMLDSAAMQELQLVSGESARLDRLSGLTRDRGAKPDGEFACLVYLDLAKSTSGGSRSRGRSRSRSSGESYRLSVPLASSRVSVRPQGEDAVRVIAEGRDIGVDAGSVGRRSSRRGSRGEQIGIDAATLLRAALTSEDAEREKLAGTVDLAPLSKEQKCALEPGQLGLWSGTLSVDDHGVGGDWPLRITGARIVLEPVEGP
jgi:hypothetical protein